MQLRDYQQQAVNDASRYLAKHNEPALLVLPTGAGKSIVCAEIVRRMWQTNRDMHPRTLVIVPSKELLEQNYAKVQAMMAPGISVGMYSASVNRKDAQADVIVATIGSIAKKAHQLGNIKLVVIDECHLVDANGKGNYRRFLADLNQYCTFHLVGMTATPYRGNGLIITKGKQPLFKSVCHETKVTDLIKAGYLSPLSLPFIRTDTVIDASNVKVDSKTGDYNIGQLSDAVMHVLPQICQQSMVAAADRRKWIAFTPSVAAAQLMVDLYNRAGIASAVVCGETGKADRERLINDFRAGNLRCLVTVLALATGFDVPDIDCIIWARPTRSPVLYVQGAGRGLRIAPGKTDCLWLDYSDTTVRMGPIDKVKGKTQTRPGTAPEKDCPKCHATVALSTSVCGYCGHEFPAPQPNKRKGKVKASNAPVLSSNFAEGKAYQVLDASYSQHLSASGKYSLKVTYHVTDGVRRQTVDSYICIGHDGYAGQKADRWWAEHARHKPIPTPKNIAAAMKFVDDLMLPDAITVEFNGKFVNIKKEVFKTHAAAI